MEREEVTRRAEKAGFIIAWLFILAGFWSCAWLALKVAAWVARVVLG